MESLINATIDMVKFDLESRAKELMGGTLEETDPRIVRESYAQASEEFLSLSDKAHAASKAVIASWRKDK